MKCDKHPEKEALAVCVGCSKFLCEDCQIKINGRNYCQECASQKSEENESENFESYLKGFLSKVKEDTNSAKNRFDNFVKEKGIDQEIQKFVNNLEDNLEEKPNSKSFEESFNKIKEAKQLFDIEALSDEEFQQLKYKYLNQILESNYKNSDPLVIIKHFKELFDIEAITQEEFEKIKKIYLSDL